MQLKLAENKLIECIENSALSRVSEAEKLHKVRTGRFLIVPESKECKIILCNITWIATKLC